MFLRLPSGGGEDAAGRLTRSAASDASATEQHMRGAPMANNDACTSRRCRMAGLRAPTIVPMPTSFFTAKTPMSDVKSSGADEPAACKHTRAQVRCTAQAPIGTRRTRAAPQERSRGGRSDWAGKC